MTTSMLAYGKATAASSCRLSIPQAIPNLLWRARCHSSSAAAPVAVPSVHSQAQAKHDDPATQRELFMNVLTANATKRDAKQYLARFKQPEQKPNCGSSSLQQERYAQNCHDQDRLDRTGVNLGGLYAPARSIADSPQFTQPHVKDATATVPEEATHVALVCMRAPQTLDDATLDGVAMTLSQLVKLDMRIAIVLGGDEQDGSAAVQQASAIMMEQATRLFNAIGKHSVEGARVISGAIESDGNDQSSDFAKRDSLSAATVTIPNLLMEPLRRSIIPIVPALAYTATGQLVQMPVGSVLAALAGLFSGLPLMSGSTERDRPSVNITLDRIIILDTAGGVPSKARSGGAHVFINLEQEYHDIDSELAERSGGVGRDDHTLDMPNVYERHRSNLGMIRACLTLLPSASSGLIISPEEAASSSQSSETEPSIGTGTRRRKNTLIHNLLTNKPMVSSSLPVARLISTPASHDEAISTAMPQATLVKRGMPLTIIPSADRKHGWLPPRTGTTTLDLETDPRVDLPRLIHLIENSFRRKLDVRHYLDRIRGRTAGLIIAGEYEGGAILTWETPPGAPADDPTRLVPYLDKFAVLSSSQGSSGVADIVFQAMVRTCFPHGVCWRSRKDNPVNKWYFERSEGTWKVPDSNWTMFWTGEGLVENEERWEDYAGVCRSVGPSWADKMKQVD